MQVPVQVKQFGFSEHFLLHSVKASSKLVLLAIKSETVELPQVCNDNIKVPYKSSLIVL